MSSPTESTQTQNDYVDQLTLQFLSKKSKYNKYLSTADPKKFEEKQLLRAKIEHHMDTIVHMTEEYCANPNVQRTNEMDDAFNDYVRTCIKYLEMKELEGNSEESVHKETYGDDNEDEEMLFAPVHTFWGKGAKKFGA